MDSGQSYSDKTTGLHDCTSDVSVGCQTSELPWSNVQCDERFGSGADGVRVPHDAIRDADAGYLLLAVAVSRD